MFSALRHLFKNMFGRKEKGLTTLTEVDLIKQSHAKLYEYDVRLRISCNAHDTTRYIEGMRINIDSHSLVTECPVCKTQLNCSSLIDLEDFYHADEAPGRLYRGKGSINIITEDQSHTYSLSILNKRLYRDSSYKS